MSWTAPKTWTSEPLTSLDLNTYVRDNQNHLKDRLDNSASRIISALSTFSTTSTDWVDIDAQKLSLTLTTHGGDVLLGYTGSVKNGKDGKYSYFNVAVDGVDRFAGSGVSMLSIGGTQDTYRPKPLSIVVLIPDLSAGSHTFTLRWKVQSGSSAHMDVTNSHPQFWAKEL